MCGSPQYVAPEIYQHVYGYDERCDLWSTGIVIFVILGGYAPFEAPSGELPGLICEGRFKFDYPEWKEVSVPPMRLIKSLLVVDPDDRATVEEALDCEWLRRRDKESLTMLASSMDGSSTKNLFEAWIRITNASDHAISNDAAEVIDGDYQVNEAEFGSEDSSSNDELKDDNEQQPSIASA